MCVETHLKQWIPPVLYLLSVVCPSLMHCFKKHQGNPFPFLCGLIWLVRECVLGFKACATQTHTNTTYKHKRHTGRNTHPYTYTNTPPFMQCGKHNDCILAPFSPGWWQVSFPLTWLKSNPIISVIALQLFFCFAGVSLLESPLLDPVSQWSAMAQMCTETDVVCQCVCVWSKASILGN